VLDALVLADADMIGVRPVDVHQLLGRTSAGPQADKAISGGCWRWPSRGRRRTVSSPCAGRAGGHRPYPARPRQSSARLETSTSCCRARRTAERGCWARWRPGRRSPTREAAGPLPPTMPDRTAGERLLGLGLLFGVTPRR